MEVKFYWDDGHNWMFNPLQRCIHHSPPTTVDGNQKSGKLTSWGKGSWNPIIYDTISTSQVGKTHRSSETSTKKQFYDSDCLGGGFKYFLFLTLPGSRDQHSPANWKDLRNRRSFWKFCGLLFESGTEVETTSYLCSWCWVAWGFKSLCSRGHKIGSIESSHVDNLQCHRSVEHARFSSDVRA